MPGVSLSDTKISEPVNSERHTRIGDPHPLPVIFGLAKTELNYLERKFIEDTNPFGFILFKRNCDNPDQIKWLIRELRHSVGRDDAPVLIDQEGGRVARLQSPQWPKYPAARAFGLLYELDPALGTEAMRLFARMINYPLTEVGITVNCAPVLDLYFTGATDAIGDRALSRRPAIVAALARLYAEVAMENGILPVVKHFPGHGRLKADPHERLPVIEASLAELESDDFVPFELLKDLPLGMTSHAIFTSIDRDNPASLSATMHNDIIRGRLGFDGLMLSDDICMKALHGTPDDLAKRVIEAGSDVVLHCNGVLTEMQAIAAALEPMSGESMARWRYAQTMIKAPIAYNPAADMGRLDILLGAVAV
jgi:beta-N-acetylhexosaminidase